MLGCIAKAASSDLDVDHSEMETVLWVRKEGECSSFRSTIWKASVHLLLAADSSTLTEVRLALDKGTEASLVRNPSPSDDDAPFMVPPRFAIAHHLLKIWASQDGPWFNDEAAAKASL